MHNLTIFHFTGHPLDPLQGALVVRRLHFENGCTLYPEITPDL